MAKGVNQIRKNLLATFGGMYHRISNTDIGSPRECLDHVPPLTVVCDIDLEKF